MLKKKPLKLLEEQSIETDIASNEERNTIDNNNEIMMIKL